MTKTIHEYFKRDDIYSYLHKLYCAEEIAQAPVVLGSALVRVALSADQWEAFHVAWPGVAVEVAQ